MDALSIRYATSEPRAVPLANALSWFESAMRIFKRAPWSWCLLGLITLASKLGLELVPGVGRAASEVVVPVIECGLFCAAAAMDRGEPISVGYAFAAFAAPPRALAAIVAAALLVSVAETGTAYALTGVNLLADPGDTRLTSDVLVAVIAAAMLVSLPVAFVPFAALFEQARFAQAFAASARGFALNVAPLLLFGLISLVLTFIGLLTFWVGLIAVLPLLATASYAAWKDIYQPRASRLTPS